MNHARGFTLLELVVVIAIFGVMSVMAYGGLASVLDSRARVDAALQATGVVQKTWQRLRADFEAIEARPIRDEFGNPQAALLSSPELGRTEFTRGGWRNPQGFERSNFERVSYRLEDQKLLRESWRVLDRGPDSQPAKSELLDGVEELRWRFLDESRQWQERWPPVQSLTPQALATSAPPRAVEITLKTKASGELRFLFNHGVRAAPAQKAPTT